MNPCFLWTLAGFGLMFVFFAYISDSLRIIINLIKWVYTKKCS